MKLHSAVLYTSDIDAVEDFYNKKLGIEIEYRSGDKFISFMFPNGSRLGIKKAVEEREVPGKQTLFIEVDSVNEWYKKAQEFNLNILKQLTEESWATEFSVLDPDGNKVQIIQPNTNT
ncbi:VOC family protein [Patescibacteria group bacterium]